ncbi:MAG TPA: hypothetical protein VN903_08475 [Polyangia bacterium]|nr:hypothetical protein [Polyangia bacterium]
MKNIRQARRSIAGICLGSLIAACGSGSNGPSGAGGSAKEGGTTGNPTGGTNGNPTGGTTGNPTGMAGNPQGGAGGNPTGGMAGNPTSGTTGNPTGGSTAGQGGASGGGGTGGGLGGSGTGGTSAAGAGGRGGSSGGGTAGGAGRGGAAGATSGAGGQAGATGVGGGGGGIASGCVSTKQWPTANPTAAGPFAVAADKNVGPLAGYTPDPIYGDQQQRFNIYRPSNLATSGYCHPILVWANGHTDNPEPNPPLCVVDSAANKWCGQYLPLMNHLASHGFVVIASLSTTTSKGDPLPTIAGLDWLLQQSETSSSPYYHRLDTANIGQLGHSEGAMSTCMVASEPRYKALAAICGTRTLSGVHTPMLFYCGGKDTTVPCDGVHDVFLTVTNQPAFFIDELASDHGWWVYQGAKGVSLSMAAAWFRAHLMGDTANRKYFYGPSCTFCTDSRVKVEQNSLIAQ